MVKEKGSFRKNGSTLNRGGAVICHICKTGEFGARRVLGLKCRYKTIKKKRATLAWGFPFVALDHRTTP